MPAKMHIATYIPICNLNKLRSENTLDQELSISYNQNEEH